MCTPSLSFSLGQLSTLFPLLALPCPALPGPSKRPRSRLHLQRHTLSCRDYCCCHCHTTDRVACSIPPFACLPAYSTHEHAHIAYYSSTVYPSSHRHHFAWPSSSIRKRRDPTVRARFKEIPTPTCLSTRGETRLRQAARGSPAPHRFSFVPVLPSCSLLSATKPLL
jgi:hypothetical protein